MRRSNRFVLLLGIVLAAVAFSATVLLVQQRPPPPATVPTTLPTVYARTNITLGTVITSDMVETRPLDIEVRPADAFGDTGLVVGKTVRADVVAGALITPAIFTGAGSVDIASLLEPGLRAIAVEVDQATGVGALINVGDRVDLLIGLTGADKFPTVTVDPTSGLLNTVCCLNTTTTKLVIQNMQVVGTLVPPVPTATAGAGTASGPTLTGAQQLVILAVTAQQAEIIKFAQLDGRISLVLRSPRDFQDQAGNPVTPEADQTSGIVLRTLIENYGLLPPEVIEAANLPSAAP